MRRSRKTASPSSSLTRLYSQRRRMAEVRQYRNRRSNYSPTLALFFLDHRVIFIILQKSSNPTFLKTACFWPSDGLTSESCIRITAYDVREKFSGLATPLGSAKLYISTLLNCQQTRFRVQLLSCTNTVAGFITLTIWRHERESSNASAESTPCKSLHHSNSLNVCILTADSVIRSM